MFDLKKYRGVIFHDTEGWYKIWRKTVLWFGKSHEEYGKFSPGHLKVPKLGLWWYPLIQSRRSMSLKPTEALCHDNEEWCEIWRRIDLSFRNWPEEFDEFWPELLKISKIFILICPFWAKYIYTVWAKKNTEELSFMKLKRGTKFREKLTCRFQIDVRDLTNFGASTREELSYKNWRGTDLWFEKWHEKFGKFLPEINE